RSLAFGLSGGQVGIIDQNLKEMQYPLTSPEEFGGGLQYSSDGLLLAWICADGTTKVWDLRENRLLGTLPDSEPGLDGGIAFSNDSKLLGVSGPDGTVLIWNLDEKSWTSQACAIAGRDLTQAEWDQYVPGEKRRETCPALGLP